MVNTIATVSSVLKEVWTSDAMEHLFFGPAWALPEPSYWTTHDPGPLTPSLTDPFLASGSGLGSAALRASTDYEIRAAAKDIMNIMGRQMIPYSEQVRARREPGMLINDAMAGRTVRIPVFSQLTKHPEKPRTKINLIAGKPKVIDWPLSETMARIEQAKHRGVLYAPWRMGHGEIRVTAIPLSAILTLDESK